MVYSHCMKSQTISLHLPDSLFKWIDQNRGSLDRSTFITQLLLTLLEKRAEPQDRERLLVDGRKQYTQETCRQTLQINEEFPVHEE